jgi:hypothetical protein
MEGSDRTLFYGTVIAFIEGTEENHENASTRMAGLRAAIYTRDLPNTKQECLPLDHDVWYRVV